MLGLAIRYGMRKSPAFIGHAGWRLSKKLVAQFPQLSDTLFAGMVVTAIRDAFTGQSDERKGEEPTG